MNFSDQINAVFSKGGFPDSANNRRNDRLQSIMDAVNAIYDEICETCSPYLNPLVRERALVIGNGLSAPDQDANLGYPVGGPPGGYLAPGGNRAPDGYNGEYHLDSQVDHVLEMWTEGQTAHRVTIRGYKASTREGLRNSTWAPATVGPYQVSWLPRSTIGFYDFGAGAAYGATAAEGGINVSFGASSNALGSALVGMILKLNGEDGDYKILTQNGAHAATVDRPIRSRMAGSMLTNGAGPGYTNVRWQIGPRGTPKIRVLPPPSLTANLYYSAYDVPRRLLNVDDEPEIPTKYHHLLWKGAMRILALENVKPDMYQMYANEYDKALAMFRKADEDEQSAIDGPSMYLASSSEQVGVRQPGQFFRDYGAY